MLRAAWPMRAHWLKLGGTAIPFSRDSFISLDALYAMMRGADEPYCLILTSHASYHGAMGRSAARTYASFSSILMHCSLARLDYYGRISSFSLQILRREYFSHAPPLGRLRPRADDVVESRLWGTIDCRANAATARFTCRSHIVNASRALYRAYFAKAARRRHCLPKLPPRSYIAQRPRRAHANKPAAYRASNDTMLI